jgi:hypothetical protein
VGLEGTVDRLVSALYSASSLQLRLFECNAGGYEAKHNCVLSGIALVENDRVSVGWDSASECFLLLVGKIEAPDVCTIYKVTTAGAIAETKIVAIPYDVAAKGTKKLNGQTIVLNETLGHARLDANFGVVSSVADRKTLSVTDSNVRLQIGSATHELRYAAPDDSYVSHSIPDVTAPPGYTATGTRTINDAEKFNDKIIMFVTGSVNEA